MVRFQSIPLERVTGNNAKSRHWYHVPQFTDNKHDDCFLVSLPYYRPWLINLPRKWLYFHQSFAYRKPLFHTTLPKQKIVDFIINAKNSSSMWNCIHGQPHAIQNLKKKKKKSWQILILRKGLICRNRVGFDTHLEIWYKIKFFTLVLIWGKWAMCAFVMNSTDKPRKSH